VDLSVVSSNTKEKNEPGVVNFSESFIIKCFPVVNFIISVAFVRLVAMPFNTS